MILRSMSNRWAMDETPALRGGRGQGAARARCAGILLMECVVYIAVFMVVLSLAFMALHRTWKTHYLLETNAQDIATSVRAGEQWRADIRHATGSIEVATASADWLVRIPSRRGPVIYRLLGANLYREIPGFSRAAVLGNVRACSMTADRRQQVTGWRWELELKSRTAKSKVRPLFTFIAVNNSTPP